MNAYRRRTAQRALGVSIGLLGLAVPVGAVAQVATAVPETTTVPLPTVVSEDFVDGLAEWRTQRLDGRSTDYRIAEIDGNAVLKAVSDDGAAALIRSISIGELSGATLRWRWRVLNSVMSERSEREKDGDDFAARILVLFGDDELSADTRALAYAWSGAEPVGASFPNPYTMSMVTYVVQSGDEYAEVWRTEERDVFADYERAFGDRPTSVAGLAIVVDTDNTMSKTTAWFDDIELSATPVPFG